ncbi:MAG: hypothetical protein PHX34_01810 [Candidatus Shapirobacteria bacterium]|nr:hypothetical protein [Candidatus Shapirobacteria bacterium]
MSKRFRYLISSLLSAVGFYFFINLPYSSHYYGLAVGAVWITFCFWFGLGIIFEHSLYIRLMSIILPLGFFVGFGLFTALLPQNFLVIFLLSLFFGIIAYVIFLVENVFLVSIGGRTPPLYRAAYTVGFMVLLLTAFFLFDSLFSFKFVYWINGLLIFLISAVIFLYLFYSVTIELADDGKSKNIWYYVLVPAFLMFQLGLVLSFWPVGIFKGSIYLVAVIYVLSSLIQVELRDRFFKKTWLTFIWISIAILAGIILTTSWR